MSALVLKMFITLHSNTTIHHVLCQFYPVYRKNIVMHIKCTVCAYIYKYLIYLYFECMVPCFY